MKTVTKCL